MTPADKVIITLTGEGYSIEAYAGRVTIAEQSVEIAPDFITIMKSGDDLFAQLPAELAHPLHCAGLNLMDAVIALMPEAA